MVVGGGHVAERKVASLLEASAAVRVVSPSLTGVLREWKDDGKIQHVDGQYEPRCLEGAFVVIGATGDRKVNEIVSADCRARGILVNIVDAPDECDFFVPSVVQRGDLTIAISTDGKSPALAKRIREELEKAYGAEYERFLVILAEVRSHLAAVCPDAARRQEVLAKLVRYDIPRLLKEGRRLDVRAHLDEVLQQSGLPTPEEWTSVEVTGGNERRDE